jgi:hypothetical protein
MKNKIVTKNYWKPTPTRWRKLGDSLLAVATILSIGGLWQFDNLRDLFSQEELRLMIIISISLGVVGKFLTNFFKDEENTEE